MQGELVVIAVGLVVALAFSTLIKAFTDSIITPLVNAVAGGGATGKGLGWTVNGQRINVGAFIGAIIYFIILMAVIYFLFVVPYRAYMRKRGKTSSVSPPPPRPVLTAGRTTCRSMRSNACTAAVSYRRRLSRAGTPARFWRSPGRRRTRQRCPARAAGAARPR